MVVTVFINRSIPLARSCIDNWTNAGAVVLRRHLNRRNRQLVGADSPILLNLGLGDAFDYRFDTVYNEPASVRAISLPSAIRRTMPDLLPRHPEVGEDCWYKGPGYGGVNKIRERRTTRATQRGWDMQLHIEGREYRVITVGDIVVQAHEKLPNGTADAYNWQWVWCGLSGLKNTGIIPLCKNAVGLIPGGERTVIGWDIILGPDRPYIIEGNTSPGVNQATAERIVKQIGEQNETPLM